MHKIRAAITAMIALALAGLPVPAAAMHASMIANMLDTASCDTHMSGAATDGHCCPEAENCDRHTKKSCDASGACALECTPLSANIVAAIELPPLAAPSLLATVAAERLIATKLHPPLPPPRV